MASGVYRIVHIASGKTYIGSAADIATRWSQHRHMLRQGNHHSAYLQRAWDKYGEQSFVFEVIEEVSMNSCIEREQYWIDTLQPTYNVYPLAGSPLGYKHSEETRAKMKANAQGRPSPMEGKHHSEDSRAKIGKAREGKPNIARRGKALSPEHRAKLSEAKTGKSLSEEHRQAISEATKGKKKPEGMGTNLRAFLTGRKHSEERIAKNRESHLGKEPGNKGKKISAEVRANVLAAQQARRARERAEKALKEAEDQSLWDADN